MDDPITTAIKQSQDAAMTSEEWKSVGIAFLLGGTTSAFWVLRQGKRFPTHREWVSSFFVSGIIAAAIISFLLGRGISMHMIVFIAIMTGFSGDIAVRLIVSVFLGALRRFFNVDLSSPSEDGALPGPKDPPTTKQP